MKTCTIRNTRFRVIDSATRNDEILGYCSNPIYPRPEICMPINGDEKDDLICILHELIHGACFDLSEDAVDEISTDIGKILWRLGWRKED
jgi:hypothetical protein